jgi:exopolyphosphatase / guanosine-5'-triphosphate,3'-diphosphate pyrophosphatase
MRVATIDIGTNSVLLLVAERQGNEIVPIIERATITRLGQGVDATRTLAPEAVRRTLDCLARYAEEIRAAGVTRVDVAGTSAMRDAAGGESFRSEAKSLLGVEPRVISGREEAELTFEGSMTGLGLTGPVTVVDVGGGSTEIVTGEVATGPNHAVSLDVGSVRLTERHVRTDPPTESEILAVRQDVRRALDGSGIVPTRTIVGVAGTVTTLAAYALDVVPYASERVHGAQLSGQRIDAAVQALAAMPLAERRKLGSVQADRADVIVAGGLIVAEVLAWARDVLEKSAGATDVEFVASDRGVRWGLAKRLIDPAKS